LSGAFEALKCHVFITESTFGLPIYNWKPQPEIFTTIQDWVGRNEAEAKTSVLIAYSLGKAQRLLSCLAPVTEKIFVHGAIWNVHQALVDAGVQLPAVERVLPDMPKDIFRGRVVIAPSSAEDSPWMRRFSPYAVGICSGWMQVRGNVRRRNADAGFALSDHADWKGLLAAVTATGAERVFVTHGFQATLSRYLNEKGISAAEAEGPSQAEGPSLAPPDNRAQAKVASEKERGEAAPPKLSGIGTDQPAHGQEDTEAFGKFYDDED
jgi:putative mRNA 3-end processing factor